MSKFKSSMLIIGLLITVVAAALITFVSLSATGLVVADPIAITVTLRDAQKEYDGTPLYASGYYIKSGELLEGDSEKVTFTRGLTDFGTGEGEAEVKILDKKGADVTRKYAITVEPAELTVSKRTINIEQETIEKEYSGEVFYADEYSITGGELCYGHKIIVPENEIGRIDVGTTAGSGEIPTICDALGNNVSKNYRINFIPGSITVTPRPITIAPIDASKEYDGTPLYAPECEIKSGSLVFGHNLEVICRKTEGESDEPFITDAGSVAVAIKSYRVTDASGADVSSNYAISGASATSTLTISQKSLIIVGRSVTSRYNGKEQWLNSSLPESVEGLAPGEKVTLEYTGRFTDIDDHSNIFEYTITKTEVAEGEDEIVNPDNYYVTAIPGIYQITKGVLSLKLKSVNLKYGDPMFELGDDAIEDYNDFNTSDLCLLQFTLPTGIYESEPEAGAELAGVGSYTYNVKWKKDVPESYTGALSAELYDLEIENGIITVIPKPIAVELNSVEFNYGETFDWGKDNENAYKNFDKVPQEIRSLLEVKIPQESDGKGGFINAKTAGWYTYTVGYSASVKESEYSNYNLIVTPAAYVINKIDATVTVSDISIQYSEVRQAKESKNPLTIDNTYFKGNNAKAGKPTITIKYTDSKGEQNSNLSEEAYTVTPLVLTMSGTFYGNITLSEAMLKNYNVPAISFKVEVSKENLNVSYNGEKQKTYDGTPFAFDVGGFNTGDNNIIVTSAIINGKAPVNAGDSVTVSYRVTIKNTLTGEDETANYVINNNAALSTTVTIAKRNLYVTGKSVTLSVKAIENNEEPELGNLYEISGLLPGDSVKIGELDSFDPDVMQYDLTVDNKKDLEANYNVIITPVYVTWVA